MDLSPYFFRGSGAISFDFLKQMEAGRARRREIWPESWPHVFSAASRPPVAACYFFAASAGWRWPYVFSQARPGPGGRMFFFSQAGPGRRWPHVFFAAGCLGHGPQKGPQNGAKSDPKSDQKEHLLESGKA